MDVLTETTYVHFGNNTEKRRKLYQMDSTRSHGGMAYPDGHAAAHLFYLSFSHHCMLHSALTGFNNAKKADRHGYGSSPHFLFFKCAQGRAGHWAGQGRHWARTHWPAREFKLRKSLHTEIFHYRRGQRMHARRAVWEGGQKLFVLSRVKEEY